MTLNPSAHCTWCGAEPGKFKIDCPNCAIRFRQELRATISYVTGLDGWGETPSEADQDSWCAYVEYRLAKIYPHANLSVSVQKDALGSSVTCDDPRVDCDDLRSLIGNDLWFEWCGGERAPAEDL